MSRPLARVRYGSPAEILTMMIVLVLMTATVVGADPICEIEPTSYDIQGNWGNWVDETLIIRNTGDGMLSGTIDPGAPYCSVSPSTFDVPGGEEVEITVTIEFDGTYCDASWDIDLGLECGTVPCHVEIRAEGPDLSIYDLPDTLRMESPAPGVPVVHVVSAHNWGCDSGYIDFAFVTAAGGFSLEDDYMEVPGQETAIFEISFLPSGALPQTATVAWDWPGAQGECVLIGTVTPYTGPDWYVATDGDDQTGNGSQSAPFRTIQRAVDAAVLGDTVILADGTYTDLGNHDIQLGDKALTFRSDSGDAEACVIDCEGNAGFVFAALETSGTDGPTFESLTIQNATVGIRADGLDFWYYPGPFIDLTVIESRVVGCQKGIDSSWSVLMIQSSKFLGNTGAGIELTGFNTTAEIVDCVFRGNDKGIDYSNSGGKASRQSKKPREEYNPPLVVRSSVFVQNRIGFEAGYLDYPGCELRECRLDSNVVGLYARPSGSSVLVEACLIRDNETDGAQIHGDPAMIFGPSRISGNGGYGIEIIAEVSITCEDVEIVGNGLWGVGIEGATPSDYGRLNLARCRVDSNLAGGLQTPSGPHAIQDCLISRNGGDGLHLGAGGSFPDELTVDGTSIVDNAGIGLVSDHDSIDLDRTLISSNVGGSVDLPLGAAITVDCVDIHGNAGGDWIAPIDGRVGQDGNISVDPRFCDPVAGDYTLMDTSPCMPGQHPDGENCGLIGRYGEGCIDLTDVDCVDEVDVLGLYFDLDRCDPDTSGAPLGHVIPMYVVLTNPSFGSVQGFIVDLEFDPATFFVVSADYAVDGLNLGSHTMGEFCVGYSEPLYPDPAGHVLLVTLGVLLVQPSGSFFAQPYYDCGHPDFPNSPVYVGGDDPDLYRPMSYAASPYGRYVDETGALTIPLAAVNDDVTWRGPATAIINPQPASVAVPWRLEREGLTVATGIGPVQLDDLDLRPYSLYWEDIEGWNPAPPDTQVVHPHEPTTFTGVYQPHPRIESIADVGNDQGRQVRLIWERCGHDDGNWPEPVTKYGVYRRQDEYKSAPEDRELGWDFLVEVPARGDAFYQAIVPTLCDSTAEGDICWSVYKVSAMAADPHTYFDSAPDSGYSVDNIVPPPPTLFQVTYGGPNELTWIASQAPDLAWYDIHRGDDEVFEPMPENRIHQTADTAWADPDGDWHHHYILVAVDDAGNGSEPAYPDELTSTGDAVPTVTELVGNFPNPFNPVTTILYTLARSEPVTLRIFDLKGRLVATLVDNERQEPGRYEVTWRGQDSRGRSAASGSYMYRLEAGGYARSGRMTLVK